jgi:hypothetical protein
LLAARPGSRRSDVAASQGSDSADARRFMDSPLNSPARCVVRALPRGDA